MGNHLLEEADQQPPRVLDPNNVSVLIAGRAYFANSARAAFVRVQNLATGEYEAIAPKDVDGWLERLRLSEAILETDYLRKRRFEGTGVLEQQKN